MVLLAVSVLEDKPLRLTLELRTVVPVTTLLELLELEPELLRVLTLELELLELTAVPALLRALS